MGAADVVRAILAPLREFTILAPLLMFWALIALGIWGGVFGFFLLLLTLPPLFRFQSFIVESYANGRAPGAFDAEFFNWVGTMWTMFPLLLALFFGIAGYLASLAWGAAGTWLVIVLAVAIFPASLAVLAITHSALQALNPLALLRVYERAGPRFIVAPLYLLAMAVLTSEVGGLPLWARIFTSLYTMFSVAALSGALIAPVSLVKDVYIPDEVPEDAVRTAADVEQARMLALNHAYGFLSRGNREGGFKHLFDTIEKDEDPQAAWDCFFYGMLGWEQKMHALFFAQHYVRDALRHGEARRALKVTMRCIYENEQFRPFREDLPALVEAAERSGNAELAEVLKRS